LPGDRADRGDGMIWQKQLPARHGREMDVIVDERGIRLVVEGMSAALTENMAGDLAHALLEAVRQHQNAGEIR
ncbi:hypothetical protein, partial [Klebsiella aerogenes]|uniref:hypothetical protein n=1 Tax=Klebsiella aerogenes TaxID=548 RepID=UPI001CC33CE8